MDCVYTADPRVVPDARLIPVISYDEILELAALGAKVMQSRSVEVGKKFGIPIYVRSSLLHRSKGTLITKETRSMEEALVRGVALDEGESKITLFRIPDRPGVAARIFKILAADNVNVDMIIQNKTETRTTDLSFTVRKSELDSAMKSVTKAARAVQAGHAVCDQHMAKVSIVGVGMRSHSGIASKMFQALAKKKINIEMISTSEIKISVIVQAQKGKEALRAIHDAFGLGKSEKDPDLRYNLKRRITR